MTKLFRYKTERGARRTLEALRRAHPVTVFTIEFGEGWVWYLRATLPNGQSGLVKRVPLRSLPQPKEAA